MQQPPAKRRLTEVSTTEKFSEELLNEGAKAKKNALSSKVVELKIQLADLNRELDQTRKDCTARDNSFAFLSRYWAQVEQDMQVTLARFGEVDMQPLRTPFLGELMETYVSPDSDLAMREKLVEISQTSKILLAKIVELALKCLGHGGKSLSKENDSVHLKNAHSLSELAKKVKQNMALQRKAVSLEEKVGVLSTEKEVVVRSNVRLQRDFAAAQNRIKELEAELETAAGEKASEEQRQGGAGAGAAGVGGVGVSGADFSSSLDQTKKLEEISIALREALIKVDAREEEVKVLKGKVGDLQGQLDAEKSSLLSRDKVEGSGYYRALDMRCKQLASDLEVSRTRLDESKAETRGLRDSQTALQRAGDHRLVKRAGALEAQRAALETKNAELRREVDRTKLSLEQVTKAEREREESQRQFQKVAAASREAEGRHRKMIATYRNERNALRAKLMLAAETGTGIGPSAAGEGTTDDAKIQREGKSQEEEKESDAKQADSLAKLGEEVASLKEKLANQDILISVLQLRSKEPKDAVALAADKRVLEEKLALAEAKLGGEPVRLGQAAPAPAAAAPAPTEKASSEDVQRLRAQYDEKSAIADALQEECDALMAELEEAGKEFETAQKRAEEIATQLQGKESAIFRQQGERIKSIQMVEMYKKRCSASAAQVAEAANAVDAQRKLVTDLEGQVNALRAVLREKDHQLALAEAGSGELKNTARKAASELETSQSRVKEGESALKDALATSRQRAVDLLAAQGDLTRAKEENERLAVRIKRLKRRMEETGVDEEDEVSVLEAQIHDLEQKILCKICKTREKSMMIVRCGHAFCSECITERLAKRDRKCPACAAVFSQSDVRHVYITT